MGFAGLIADRTAGLAGRLAGCLAFAAAAFLHGFLKILRVQRLYMLHRFLLMNYILERHYRVIIAHRIG